MKIKKFNIASNKSIVIKSVLALILICALALWVRQLSQNLRLPHSVTPELSDQADSDKQYPDYSNKEFTVTVDSHPVFGAILITGDGHTLYQTEKADLTTAAFVPLFAVSSNPIAPEKLQKKISAKTFNNQLVVHYKGKPLYTFTNDKTAGDAFGDGYDAQWFVVKVTEPW